MKKWIRMIALAGLLAVSGCAGTEKEAAKEQKVEETKAANSYQQISQEEAKKLMETEEDYIILDVRTMEEFSQGHIPGAICVPNETIGSERPGELPDLDQLILVYCRSGNRSKQASSKLAEMGYTRIMEFGGINTWTGETTTE